MISGQGTWAEETRRLASLAWPVVIGSLGWVAFGVTDIAFAGQLGAEVVAAVAAGHLWSFAVLIFALGTLAGLDPILAQAWGAGDRARLAAGIRGAVRLALVMAVPVGIWHLVAEGALGALNQPPEILADAGAYCRAVALGVLPQLVFAALVQGLQGMGRMRAPMIAVLVANGVNIALDGALMLGWFGAPELGATGCGLATTGSRVVMLGVLLVVAWPSLAPLARLRTRALPLRELWRAGVPVGLQRGLEVWAFQLVAIMAGWLGALSVAAHAVALSVCSVTFMIPLGLSAAAATRVGNLVGAGHRWSRAGAVAVLSGAAVMAGSGLILVTAPDLLASLYTADPAMVAASATVLPIAAGFQVFDGIQVVAFGVLRGVGDVRLPSLANVVGYYLIGLPVGYILGIRLELGLPGLWVGLAVALFLIAFMLLARLRHVAQRQPPPAVTPSVGRA